MCYVYSQCYDISCATLYIILINNIHFFTLQQTEVVQRVPGRLRLQIFLTFGTTRMVGRQPYALAAFTPGEIPGTHFQGLSRPQGTWFRRGEPRKKKSPVTPPGINPGTSRLVAQCLNHYATPGLQNRKDIVTLIIFVLRRYCVAFGIDTTKLTSFCRPVIYLYVEIIF